MKSSIRALAFALACLPTLALATGQVGEQAPDFSLQNTDGQTVDVHFGDGVVTLLAFVGWS